jgi:hypothetical protein
MLTPAQNPRGLAKTILTTVPSGKLNRHFTVENNRGPIRPKSLARIGADRAAEIS